MQALLGLRKVKSPNTNEYTVLDGLSGFGKSLILYERELQHVVARRVSLFASTYGVVENMKTNKNFSGIFPCGCFYEEKRVLRITHGSVWCSI